MSITIFGIDSDELSFSMNYGSLRTIELDKIIANIRLVVQANNGGLSNDLNVAVNSYVNQLKTLFEPHIKIITNY
jgi:hypothetical protein